MKRFTLLKSFLLLCALIAGAGTAWADDPANWSYTVVDGDATKLNTADKTFTVDESHVWSYDGTTVKSGSPTVIIGKSTNYALKFGSSGSVYFSPVILSTDAFSDKAVTKVSLYLKHNGSKPGALTVKQGSITIGTATTSSTSNWITVTCSETNKGTGGTLEIKYEVAQALYINKIEVWYEELGKGEITTTTIDATGITNTAIASGTAAGTLKATVKAGGTTIDGAAVSWSSSDEGVAKISNTGAVTLVAAGTTTITADYAGVTDTYKPSSATYELTVTNSPSTIYEKVTNSNQLVAGNEYILVATGYNVAMGAENTNKRAVVDVKVTDNKVTISDEAVAVLTLGGNTDAWTFLASDNNQYLAYSGSSNELHTSTNATEEASKWKVTDDFQLESANVSGRILMYNSGSSRFACYTGTQQKAVLFVKEGSATDTKVEPELSYTTTTYKVSFDEASTFVAPTLINPHNLTVTYTSDDENLAIVDENTGEVVLDDTTEGTVTITASFAGNDDYKAGKASYSITLYDANKKGSIGNPYTVAEVLSAANTKGVYVRGFITGFYTNDGITTSGKTNLALAETAGDTDKDNNIAVQLADDLRTAWNIDDHDYIGVEVLVKGNIESYFSKQGVKSPTEIIAVSAPATVTDAGWATWVAPFNVEAPSSTEAYSVKLNGTSTELTKLTFIPQDMPVLLKNAGSYEFPVTDAVPDVLIDNDLKVSDGTVTSANNAYVLAKPEGKEVGFYKWIGTSDSPAIPAGKVYLVYTASSAPDFIGFGDATGISSIENGQVTIDNSEVYNLAGQRVALPTKGLYIINGKKYVVK